MKQWLANLKETRFVKGIVYTIVMPVVINGYWRAFNKKV